MILPIIIFSFVLCIITFWLGYVVSLKIQKSRLEDAKTQARKIIEDAKSEAESYKKTAKLEVSEEAAKTRADLEAKERKFQREMYQIEKRLNDRTASLDKKQESVNTKERDLVKKEKDLVVKERALMLKAEKLDNELKEISNRLQRISRMTVQEAKNELLQSLENKVKKESAQMIKDIIDSAQKEADKEAAEIVVSAIQRCATDHTVESTVSVVSLPSEDMKGRIIGREGRNIRSFENLTGIEIIIDDTPEAITLSGFDPVRREIARIAMEKLVSDGRINPGRIEVVVEKAKKEIDEIIKKTAEETVNELGISEFHPEIMKYLGRLRYRTSYGQNVLQHSKEVAHLSALMAGELGLDTALARRSGLLHDIGKAADHTLEGTHALIGADIAKRYNEDYIVINAIAAHHEEVEPVSPIAVLVQAADAISGSRPGARRDTIEAYLERVEKLEDIAVDVEGVEKVFALQAGRELRVIVEPSKISDAEAIVLSGEVAARIEKELKYPGQIKVTVIREIRATEYAK
ncbi:ribonuclease Y [candidate division WOR-3 bacterium]|nr:ribonuclease Y [candidate division WOR-3 bacterium]